VLLLASDEIEINVDVGRTFIRTSDVSVDIEMSAVTANCERSARALKLEIALILAVLARASTGEIARVDDDESVAVAISVAMILLVSDPTILRLTSALCVVIALKPSVLVATTVTASSWFTSASALSVEVV